jgi:hypothetical protein
MTGELQETFGKRISRDLLKFFKPLEWTGFEFDIPTPVDEFVLVFEVVKKAEKIFRVRSVPKYGSVNVQHYCATIPCMGQSRIIPLLLNNLTTIMGKDPQRKYHFTLVCESFTQARDNLFPDSQSQNDNILLRI